MHSLSKGNLKNMKKKTNIDELPLKDGVVPGVVVADDYGKPHKGPKFK